jgi:carboxylate-amine ligase
MAQMLARDGATIGSRPGQPAVDGFASTDAFSLGAEEEFMLVDPVTGELAPTACAVLEACPDGAGRLEHEVVQSVVESGTPVCSDPSQIEHHLRAQRARLVSGATRAGSALVAAGTHPCGLASQPLVEDTRYAALERDYPWVLQEAATYGLHVHVGIQGADRAIDVCNRLRAWLPHLLALSANSPFWKGEATGLASTRVLLAQLYPRSGMPPVFADYADYEQTIEALRRGSAIRDFSYTWWFVRPHPRYGTLEVRVCDAQTDARSSAALAALVQALAASIDDALDAGVAPDIVPDVICAENLWAAARSGCDGTLIDVETGFAISTRRAIRELLLRLRPWFEHFGSSAYLPRLHALLDMNGARQQLQAVADGRTLTELVAWMGDRTGEAR